jgi:hypothetical protein
VLALIDEMLAGAQLLIHLIKLFVSVVFITFCICWSVKLLPLFSANPKRAALFYDKSLSGEDIYDPFLRQVL